MLGDHDIYVDYQYYPACGSLAAVFQQHCGLLLLLPWCLHGGKAAALQPLRRPSALALKSWQDTAKELVPAAAEAFKDS